VTADERCRQAISQVPPKSNKALVEQAIGLGQDNAPAGAPGHQRLKANKSSGCGREQIQFFEPFLYNAHLPRWILANQGKRARRAITEPSLELLAARQ
jgi:hypothetical protein